MPTPKKEKRKNKAKLPNLQLSETVAVSSEKRCHFRSHTLVHACKTVAHTLYGKAMGFLHKKTTPVTLPEVLSTVLFICVFQVLSRAALLAE